MKIKNLVIVLIVIAILIFGAISVFTKKDAEQPSVPVSATTTAEVVTTVEVKTLTYATSSSKVIVEYPQFSNQPELNAKIETEAKDLFATNTDNLNINLKDLASYGVPITDRMLVFEKKIDRNRMYINNQTGITSIIYKQYVDMGGAHGTFFYGSSVFDLKTGMELKLDDFLQSYHSFVRTYAKDEIVKTATTSKTCVNCEFLEGRIDSQAELVSPFFSLNAQGLTFLYGAYDLASYAATSGGEEIFIPKSSLQGLIKRDW